MRASLGAVHECYMAARMRVEPVEQPADLGA
jgi:hypothetical protein